MIKNEILDIKIIFKNIKNIFKNILSFQTNNLFYKNQKIVFKNNSLKRFFIIFFENIINPDLKGSTLLKTLLIIFKNTFFWGLKNEK